VDFRADRALSPFLVVETEGWESGGGGVGNSGGEEHSHFHLTKGRRKRGTFGLTKGDAYRERKIGEKEK